jgi:hypothetical protein
MCPSDTRELDESDLVFKPSGVVFQGGIDGLVERLGRRPNINGREVRSLI